MSTSTINTLKITSLQLLKIALLAALLGGLAAALPSNLTHIKASAAVLTLGEIAKEV